LTTQPYQQAPSTDDSRLLSDFLQELNIARRSLTLYPPDHPQVAASSKKTLDKLNILLGNRQEVVLGVAPDALFFEHQWLDKENRAFKTFAVFLSNLGIASLSFRQGLSATELIRFCQLLRSDQETVENFGGFPLLLQQQQIERISVIPIDYSAFQAKADNSPSKPRLGNELWEDFLHGLLDDILDLGQGGMRLDPRTIAELLNEKLAAENENPLPAAAVNDFVEQLLGQPVISSSRSAASELGELLNHLSPRLQQSFLAGTFHALEQNPDDAEQVIASLSPQLRKSSLDPRLQQQLKSSPRLVELVSQLSASQSVEQSNRSNVEGAAMSKEMVKARLDILFSEEQHDNFLPDNYSSALQNIFSDDNTSNLPEEVREELRDDYAKQSVEEQCCAVIFELLDHSEQLQDEEAIQQNLLDLSRFFLDTGNFVALRDIYLNWSHYIHSGNARMDIFAERVLANHCQQTFMLEVLDSHEIWGEEQQQPIQNYIAAVGETYAEPVVERLAAAKEYRQRRYWMEVLAAIGADANQLLVQALNDERWYLIRNLLIVLGKNLAPATLKAINRLADHPHPKVRQEVMRVLFHCNPATANRMLTKELNSDDPEAQLSAIQVANLSQDPEVLSLLHRWLQKEADNDHELACKNEILTTLASIGSRDSLSLLRHLLQKKGLFTSKRQKQFQLQIIESFARYPRREAEKILQEVAGCRQSQHAKLAAKLLDELRGGAA